MTTITRREVCKPCSSFDTALPLASWLPLSLISRVDTALCLSSLPNELLTLIESFLSPLTLITLEATSFKFRCRFTERRWETLYKALASNKPPPSDYFGFGLSSSLPVSPTSFRGITVVERFMFFCSVVQIGFLGQFSHRRAARDLFFPPLPRINMCPPYKTACMLLGLGYGTQRCAACGSIELSQCSDWVRPCSNCDDVYHRTCFEKAMKSRCPNYGFAFVRYDDERVGVVDEVYGRR